MNGFGGFVSLDENIEHEMVVKKSRFICALRMAETPEQATEELAVIRKKHYNATHNCSAMVLHADRSFVKASDDGEPQGTAGVPMLEVMQKNGVTNILAVVTRYFGGTLLGAGGLVRAYGGSVAEALRLAKLVQFIQADVYQFHIDYNDYGKLCSVAAEFGATVEGEFLEIVRVRVVLEQALRVQFTDRVTQAFMGANLWRITGECLIKQPV